MTVNGGLVMADAIIVCVIFGCVIVAAIAGAIILICKSIKKNRNGERKENSAAKKKSSPYKKTFTFAFLISFFHAFTKRNKKK